MAIPDGKPATDFSAMNREWVRGVAAEAAAAGGLPSVSGSDNGKVLTVVSGEWEAATPAASGIPAPAEPSDGDVLTYSSTDSAWVAAAPSESLHAYEVLLNNDVSDPDVRFETIANASEILSAAIDNGRALICPDAGAYYVGVSEGIDEQLNEYYSLNIYSLNTPESGAIVLSLTHSFAAVLKSNIASEKFAFKWDDEEYWDIAMTPDAN